MFLHFVKASIADGHVAYNFRSTHGLFDDGRSYMIASVVINLLLSILRVKFHDIVVWGS